jgi:hypothetical protein
LKLRKLPIERIVAHSLKQFCGSVHVGNDTMGNITVQGRQLQWLVQGVSGAAAFAIGLKSYPAAPPVWIIEFRRPC